MLASSYDFILEPLVFYINSHSLVVALPCTLMPPQSLSRPLSSELQTLTHSYPQDICTRRSFGSIHPTPEKECLLRAPPACVLSNLTDGTPPNHPENLKATLDFSPLPGDPSIPKFPNTPRTCWLLPRLRSRVGLLISPPPHPHLASTGLPKAAST